MYVMCAHADGCDGKKRGNRLTSDWAAQRRLCLTSPLGDKSDDDPASGRTSREGPQLPPPQKSPGANSREGASAAEGCCILHQKGGQ